MLFPAIAVFGFGDSGRRSSWPRFQCMTFGSGIRSNAGLVVVGALAFGVASIAFTATASSPASAFSFTIAVVLSLLNVERGTPSGGCIGG